MAINEQHAAALNRALLKCLMEWTAETMPGQLPPPDMVMAVMVRAIGGIFKGLPNDGDKVQLASDVLEAMLLLSGVPAAQILQYRRLYRNDALRDLLPAGNA